MILSMTTTLAVIIRLVATVVMIVVRIVILDGQIASIIVVELLKNIEHRRVKLLTFLRLKVLLLVNIAFTLRVVLSKVTARLTNC